MAADKVDSHSSFMTGVVSAWNRFTGKTYDRHSGDPKNR
ncbi:hypothetical protein BSM4216_2076 [Bacillus smithii]|nr:hypothetical protein BSM4216_2076 [Bacillus smithii]